MMIHCEQVYFSYGAKPVLKDLSVSFRAGELCAVVGPNGCGKTTLIRLLSGLNRPSGGSVLLNGKPLAEYSRKELAKQIALLPQGRPVPEISVEDTVADARFPYLDLTRRLSTKDRQAVERALAQTDTAQLREKNLRELSGGERQRVYLAMLLAQETPTVLLDEPTTYLDLRHQLAGMEMLRQMRDQGKCVVAVLHDLPLAFRFCDRVLVLQNGTVCADGVPEEVAQGKSLEEAFGVRCIPAQVDGQTEYFFRKVR